MSEENEKLRVGSFAEVDGDAIKMFFESKGSSVFIHGANCRRVMGAGIAAQVREQIAPLYFLDAFDSRPANQRFGSFSATVLAEDENQVKVGVNLYTQLDPGPNFDINALVNSLRSFVSTVKDTSRADFTIFSPKIGAGIGGGDWEKIEQVLREELKDFNVMIVNFNQVKEN